MTAPAQVPFQLTPARADGDLAGAVGELIARVSATDGIPPFSDQGLVEWRTHRRSLTVAREVDDRGAPVPGAALHGADILGAALLGAGELELTVDPNYRGRGIGTGLLTSVLSEHTGSLLCWAHGNSPAAAALAAQHGFVPVRTLLRLGAPVPEESAPTPPIEGYGVRNFHPGDDDVEWIALNARVFADHPEQGKLTVQDLTERRAEPWFHTDDFLLLTDAAGTIVGYNWLKVTGSADDRSLTGEVYAIGVAPEAAGHGLGRLLLNRGFDQLRVRGIPRVSLYVEGDNAPALALYRSAGFDTEATSVQYRRDSPSA